MLEHVPAWLGTLLRHRRAGHQKLVAADPAIGIGAGLIDLTSPAFEPGARLPERFTADGAGVSPPLVWAGVPDGAASLALIVEDPDAPATAPLVHALLWDLPADTRRLAEGAIGGGGDEDGGAGRGEGGGGATGETGRNSFLRKGWLPPDPPTGHGEHDYVFQLFALSAALDLGAGAGRSALVAGLAGRVLASGVLIGTYSRGATAPVTTGGATAGPLPA